jgi:hypothetical protein
MHDWNELCSFRRVAKSCVTCVSQPTSDLHVFPTVTRQNVAVVSCRLWTRSDLEAAKTDTGARLLLVEISSRETVRQSRRPQFMSSLCAYRKIEWALKLHARDRMSLLERLQPSEPLQTTMRQKICRRHSFHTILTLGMRRPEHNAHDSSTSTIVCL